MKTLASVKDQLEKLIDKFETEGLEVSIHYDEPFFISSETALNAKIFLNILPQNISYPRIAPLDDSDLEMVWGDKDNRILVIIDKHLLHYVLKAGSQQSIYGNAIDWRGVIPRELLEALAEATTPKDLFE